MWVVPHANPDLVLRPYSLAIAALESLRPLGYSGLILYVLPHFVTEYAFPGLAAKSESIACFTAVGSPFAVHSA